MDPSRGTESSQRAAIASDGAHLSIGDRTAAYHSAFPGYTDAVRLHHEQIDVAYQTHDD